MTRVLVVDDELTWLELMAEVLAAFDFEVIVASDGSEVLECARRERPDIILVDVMTPGLDGREVARQLKQDSELRSIPIVLMSSMDEQDVNWREAGADGFRHKGPDVLSLPADLRRLIED